MERLGGGCDLGGRETELLLKIVETSVVEFEKDRRDNFGGDEDKIEAVLAMSFSKNNGPKPVTVPVSSNPVPGDTTGSPKVSEVAERLAACRKAPATILGCGVF